MQGALTAEPSKPKARNLGYWFLKLSNSNGVSQLSPTVMTSWDKQHKGD